MMDNSNIKNEHTNGEITIVWQPGKCIHSGMCLRNSPDVLQVNDKHWIKPEASTTERLESH